MACGTKSSPAPLVHRPTCFRGSSTNMQTSFQEEYIKYLKSGNVKEKNINSIIQETTSGTFSAPKLKTNASKERLHFCLECGKSFIRQPDVRRLRRIHTGEKPDYCSDCGKFLTLQSNLKKRQRTHTGEKPFHCSECGKSFRRHDTLKEHRLIHTGEKKHPEA